MPAPSTLPHLSSHAGAPPVLHAEPGDAPGWAARHRDALRAAALEHGAVLVRGLGLHDRAQVAAVFGRLADDLVAEREAFAPRTAHGDGVYSSTPWPANQPMCMHHELSYTWEPPGLLLFACLRAPESGGATAVADAAAVLEALPRDLASRFAQEGWLLTRSYNDEIGTSWAEAFGTDDRAAVEGYCRANGIEVAWTADGELRTWQRRPAVVRHPATGRWCWFNQIAFLNEWTLAPEVREYLVDVYGADGLPFNTRFGNGDPIGADVVELVNATYEAHTRREPWRDGDLMLVDNIGAAHSREPFTGEREVLAGLGDPVRPGGPR